MKQKILKLERERLDLVKEARANLDRMDDASSEKELKVIEGKHDRAMRRIDEIDLEIRELKSEADNGEGDPRRPMGAPASTEPDPRNQWFDTATGKEVRVVQRGQRFATERPEVTLGATLRAMACGPRNEAEKRALGEGTDSAGGYTVPTPLAANFIDLLRARSHVFAAGAQTIELPSETLGIARVETDPVPAWRAEAGSLAVSDPVLGKTTFTARSLGVLTKVSRELIQDSANIEPILEQVFAQSFAQEVDRVALMGSGTPPEPKGISNWTSVDEQSMGINGLAITTYAEILAAMQALEDANAEAPTAAIMAPRSKFTLAGLTATDDQPLNAPPDYVGDYLES